MKISTERLKQIIEEELKDMSEGGFAGHYDPSERLPLGYKMPPENKATEAMKLLSQLRSLTTEDWSREVGATYDKLLTLLQEIEEDLNINP
jgi:hypothetical protein